MSTDIETMSAKELTTLIAKASQRKKKLNKRKPVAAVRKRILAIAKAEGYTLGELFGASHAARAPAAAKPGRPAKRASAKAGSKVAPKYRNTSNATETWAGRGKQPRWLAAEIAKGCKLEEFKI